MISTNLYSSETGPFEYKFSYSEAKDILYVAFRDPSTFVQTADFAVKCYDLYGAHLWLRAFVDPGIQPDLTQGNGFIASAHIPDLVNDLHRLSNLDGSIHTGWFYGSFSPMRYKQLEWDDFDIEAEDDEAVLAKPSLPMHVQEQLGFYVYALRDPRNKEVFYVGKGQNDRIIQHVIQAKSSSEQATESLKLTRIQEIEQSGLEVEHLLLRFGLDDEETALIVEQAVIDAYLAAGLTLTNLVHGHNSADYGLSSLDAVAAKLYADPLPPIDAPLIMLKINRLWKTDMNPAEIMHATHGYWKIGPDARAEAKYALGIAHGIVRGVYRVGSWHESTIEGHVNRWWFEASDAPELQHLLGKHVKDAFVPGSSNPYQKYLEGYLPNA